MKITKNSNYTSFGKDILNTIKINNISRIKGERI